MPSLLQVEAFLPLEFPIRYHIYSTAAAADCYQATVIYYYGIQEGLLEKLARAIWLSLLLQNLF